MPPIRLNRRRFLAAAAGLAVAAPAVAGAKLPVSAKSPLSTDEKLTPYDAVTGYNNFYEFGTGKEDPARNATKFRTSPWSVSRPQSCSRGGPSESEPCWRASKCVRRLPAMPRRSLSPRARCFGALAAAVLPVLAGCESLRQLRLGIGAFLGHTEADYDELEAHRAAHRAVPAEQAAAAPSPATD